MSAPVLDRRTIDFAASSYYTPSYSLICEGACNPQIARVDRLIEKRNSNTTSKIDFRRLLSLDDHEELVGLQRTLTYTDHVTGIDETRAVCTACGKSRRFGGNPPVGRAK